MKTQVTLLAICLLGAGMANGQTTTNSSSTPGTTTNATYGTSPVTTDSTNLSNSNATTTTDSGTMNNGTVNSSGSMNSAATPTYGTTTTSTDYSSTDRPSRVKSGKDYKNFVFGIYAGLNSTRLTGEDLNSDDIRGRLGYQAGFFVRGGGRLYGQLGAEYFASSSNYYSPGDGTTATEIRDQINIQYVQIPVYIGYKLLESDRGISAIRLQAGLEYANRINSNSGDFNLTNSEIKSGTFNGLGQLGFDIGPLLIDLTYHHGFSDAVSGTGFNGSQRRIVSASVGFKF